MNDDSVMVVFKTTFIGTLLIKEIMCQYITFWADLYIFFGSILYSVQTDNINRITLNRFPLLERPSQGITRYITSPYIAADVLNCMCIRAH